MANPKILILTVSHGASHERVADALRKALLEIQPQLTVVVADALRLCARWFRVYYDSYEIPLKYWPALWGWIEDKQHRHTSTGPGWLYRRGGQGLFRFLQEFDPDIVVATEVGTCELAAMFKREIHSRFCLVGAPTGMDVDRPWARPEVDLYVTPPGEPVVQLKARSVPSAKIIACGMPIDPAFAWTPDRDTVRRRLGVQPDVPLLLVLFGGEGHGEPRRILPGLRKITRPLQVVCIAGRNLRLEEELRGQGGDHPQFRVFGWVDNVHDWMAAADILLSKPGASTLIEAFNSGLPLLAFDPLPGNERRACDLIEKWQVGYWIRQPVELAPTIERLLADPAELARLRANARALARPQAAHEAAEAILKGWQSRS